MTKQEIIQIAYKEHWDAVKDYVNNTGWCRFWSIFNPIKGKEDSPYISDLDLPDDYEHTAYSWRPKSLQGIEDNRGWIKIESEKDFDFENGKYYEIGFMDYNGSFRNQGVRRYEDGFKDDSNYWLKPFPTHYKLIVTSSPHY